MSWPEAYTEHKAVLAEVLLAQPGQDREQQYIDAHWKHVSYDTQGNGYGYGRLV